MRTTVDIPETLLREAKERAARRGSTLGQVVEEALRATFARTDAAADEGPVELPTYGEGGVLPGVDLDDSAALLDLMEGRD
ncbi:MAG TPA: hypothetical protein VHC01_12945 [Gaiellaceae bacterium]|jgi:hypothetical protein|nr:hypothetical protein [Gaiellaceae bacterium]